MGSPYSVVGSVRGFIVLYRDHRKGSEGPPGGSTCPGGPYGLGSHADMAETTLRSITNSGIWIPMLAPTCSTMISSDEPRCRGFKQSHIQFPLSIGTLLARDSIVGIPIPCSISLPASHFTRSVMHDPVTNYLVTLSSL